MPLATCRRCLNDFHRESLLLDEIANWKGRALTAEQSLVALKARAAALDLETLRRIRMLVHPDKHGGSALANEITQTLNDWIGRSA